MGRTLEVVGGAVAFAIVGWWVYVGFLVVRELARGYFDAA